MTKQELITYVQGRVYQNAGKEVTGAMAQEALITMIEDCYNSKTVQDVTVAGSVLTILFTDSTTAQFNVGGGSAPDYNLANNIIPKWNVDNKTFVTGNMESFQSGTITNLAGTGSTLNISNVRSGASTLSLGTDRITLNTTGNIILGSGSLGKLYYGTVATANEVAKKSDINNYNLSTNAIAKWDDSAKTFVTGNLSSTFVGSTTTLSSSLTSTGAALTLANRVGGNSSINLSNSGIAINASGYIVLSPGGSNKLYYGEALDQNEVVKRSDVAFDYGTLVNGMEVLTSETFNGRPVYVQRRDMLLDDSESAVIYLTNLGDSPHCWIEPAYSYITNMDNIKLIPYPFTVSNGGTFMTPAIQFLVRGSDLGINISNLPTTVNGATMTLVVKYTKA